MNPIKASDLYEDDGALKKLLKELNAVGDKLTELKNQRLAEASEIEKALTTTKAGSRGGRTEIDQAAKEAAALERAYKSLNFELSENGKKLAGVKLALQEQRRINKLEQKQIRAVAGSYDALSAQYSINKVALNKLTDEQRLNTKEGKELEQQTAAIFEEMKKLQERTGKHTLSVGDYGKALRSAVGDQKKLALELKRTKEEFVEASGIVGASEESLTAYQDRISELTDEIDSLGKITGKTADDFKDGFLDKLSETDGVAGQAARGVKGFGNALKGLLANPVVVILATLAGVLITLFNAFKRSEKGADLFAKATGLINGILSQLTALADTVADAVIFIFENPQQALEDFGNLLLSQVINRFKAIPALVFAVGKAFGSLVTGDLEGARKAAGEATTAFAQLTTGLDAGQQKEFTDAVKELTKEVIDETNAFIQLEAARRAIRKENRLLAASVEAVATAEAKANIIADDTTRSFAERRAAQEEARKELEKRAALEVRLARNNLNLLRQEIALRRNNGEEVEDLLDQQLGAFRELKGAEREYTVAVLDNERTRRELRQDELERNLDFLIDGFDNQKTINERQIADERLTLAERRAILEETNRLSDTSFDEQIKTIQEFTNVRVDANALIEASDARVLNERIRSLGLSEIIEGRLLEIVRDRRSANQDLAEAQNDLDQAAQEQSLKALEQQQADAKTSFELVRRTEREKAEFAIEQKKAELAAIRALNQELGSTVVPVDTTGLERELTALTGKLDQARRATGLAQFDEYQKLAASEFALLEKTEQEKTVFRLEQERDRLKKILQLNEEFGKQLTSQQRQIITNQIAALDAEVSKVEQEDGKDIYDLFGITLTDEKKAAIAQSFAFIKQQITALTQQRLQEAQTAVAAANQEVNERQRLLEIEQQNALAGEASRVDSARRELAEQKKIQADALKEQEAAQKAQRRAQTIEQTGNLLTASSKILQTLGFPAAVPFIAAMFGFFTAQKIKAAKLAEQFGGGGTGVFAGTGSHATGDNIAFGQRNGKTLQAEPKERWAIFNKVATGKYGGWLEHLITMANAGNLEEAFVNRGTVDSNTVALAPVVNLTTDDYKGYQRNRYLGIIAENTGSKTYIDGKGRTVEKNGNVTTITS